MFSAKELKEYIEPKLKESGIIHSWSEQGGSVSLSIPKQNENGFDIELNCSPDDGALIWGNWHSNIDEDTQFPNIEAVGGMIRDMLSTGMRVREKLAGGKPYKGYLEYFDGHMWVTDEMTGVMFYNYFGKRTEKIYQNDVLPPRDL